MFKSHLEMIGMNEPISRKARFFNTYLRSLKGSEDIRANEKKSSVFSYADISSKSIYKDSVYAAERITAPGYHYNPVSRETYGKTPRNLNISYHRK
uniref:Putative myofilin n=1 Tax=Corethrella appendiculata TaxID=1370023 RepID=U5EKZ6_9DIPT